MLETRLLRALFAALLLASGGARAGTAGEAGPAQEALARGKLIEKVVTLHDPEQSYALYLPSGYDPERKWPILYGFSPAGRGKDPVWLFKPAAEKYGWILVGSNNSRNGPWEPIAAAIEALLKDTPARLAVDPARRYSTGFSGGARVGMYLAAEEKFPGSIPTGAGLSRGQKMPRKGEMTVFSMCGLDCFNHAELLQLESRLNAAGVRNRMATFEGGHQWPPREMCGAGLRYMELVWQVEHGGRETEAVRAMLELERKDAEKLLATRGQFMRGRARLAELAGLSGDAALAARLAEVEAGEKYRAEKLLVERLAEIAAELGRVEDENARFEKSVELYRKFLADHPDTEAAEKLKVQLLATARQYAVGGSVLMSRKDYRRAETYLRRARVFAPKDRSLAYNLACALARNGSTDAALETLAESVKLGFTDREHISKDPDLESLREDPRYAKILDSLPAGGDPGKGGGPGPEAGDGN